MKNLSIAIVALLVLVFSLFSREPAVGTAFTPSTTASATPRVQPSTPRPPAARRDTYETTWPVMPGATVDSLTDELATLVKNLREGANEVTVKLAPLDDDGPSGTIVTPTDADRNAIRIEVAALFE